MSGPRGLTVHHKSIYRYSEPVSFGEHRAMFGPRSSHDMRLVTSQLCMTPTPTRLYWLHDLFARHDDRDQRRISVCPAHRERRLLSGRP
ncbi:transglutaminase N-terminal domain-containing protein [Paraburkholderia sp. RAU2J]|uniref:transglutaminase N-terminal domain-containing protein n=1 Tax=Paraburkholderia sp. RAU2J TaxID=1938810 RepID=UPI001F543508|nr:transglutaminase N-terminal domain-containing protein [Paraburkholderia sp. RAU2J]